MISLATLPKSDLTPGNGTNRSPRNKGNTGKKNSTKTFKENLPIPLK